MQAISLKISVNGGLVAVVFAWGFTTLAAQFSLEIHYRGIPLQEQPINENINELEVELSNLVEATVKAILIAKETQKLENALVIRDELHRLPNYLMKEVLNGVILNLVKIDPLLCRWFVLDIFLRDAEPNGKADVAERINLLIADLRSP